MAILAKGADPVTTPRRRAARPAGVAGSGRLGAAVRQSTETVDVPRPDCLPAWADLVGRTITQVLVSARGDLGIVLDDRQLSVAPSPDFEAWQLAGHDGERLICGPGGRVTHFSPTRAPD